MTQPRISSSYRVLPSRWIEVAPVFGGDAPQKKRNLNPTRHEAISRERRKERDNAVPTVLKNKVVSFGAMIDHPKIF